MATEWVWWHKWEQKQKFYCGFAIIVEKKTSLIKTMLGWPIRGCKWKAPVSPTESFSPFSLFYPSRSVRISPHPSLIPPLFSSLSVGLLFVVLFEYEAQQENETLQGLQRKKVSFVRLRIITSRSLFPTNVAATYDFVCIEIYFMCYACLTSMATCP